MKSKFHRIWNYVRTCASTAFRGTVDSALDWSGIIGVGVLGAGLQWAGYRITFDPGWMGIIASGVIYIIVAWLTFFLLRFLFFAPCKLHFDGQKEIARLSLALDNKEARQRAFDALWELRSEGISLRNKPLTEADGFNNWKAQYEKWRGMVLEKSRLVDPNLFRWLERLDRTQPVPSNVELSGSEHEKYARIMSEILQRLERYLVRGFLGAT